VRFEDRQLTFRTSLHSNIYSGGSGKPWLISTGFDPFAMKDTLDRTDFCSLNILFNYRNGYDTSESVES